MSLNTNFLTGIPDIVPQDPGTFQNLTTDLICREANMNNTTIFCDKNALLPEEHVCERHLAGIHQRILCLYKEMKI